jgi:LPS-assembly protein
LPNDLAFSGFKNSAPGEYATNSNSYIAPELSRLEESSSRRWYTSLKDIANFSQHLQGKVDYTYASDDYLQQDIHLPSIMNSQLLQQASLSYSAPYWQSSILLQQYQTLHPITLLQNSNQYERLPDLTFNLNYPATSNFNYLLSGEGVNFNRLLNPGESFPSSNGQPTSGVRTNVQPGISMSLANSYAYFRPTAQWSLTQYNLANPSYNYPNNITRSLPIINIDSGLYFDRNSSFFGQDYHQTLEPRLFYLYVPYKDQYQIPVFDTNIQSFTFDQLFQTNRFNGTDRIGDANQLSFALTSRLLSSASGEEKSKFGIGRIYYADTPRKVQLCNQYGCQDSQTNVGAISSTERLSPYVGFFNYALSNNWSFRSNAAWDPMTHETNNASAGFQFMPATNHIVNFSYNYVEYGDTYSPQTTLPTDPKNNLNQIGASTVWPIKQNIDGLAAWNYNISHEHFQNYLYGISYNTCCYDAFCFI